MAIRTTAAALLLGFFICSMGCNSAGNFLSEMKPPEEQVPADDPQAEWDFVGEEARKHRPIETDPDPWWQSSIMSPRARAIERSLGVD